MPGRYHVGSSVDGTIVSLLAQLLEIKRDFKQSSRFFSFYEQRKILEVDTLMKTLTSSEPTP